MNTIKLGSLIDSEQQRDAIHVAVAPVVCGHVKLYPGDHAMSELPDEDYSGCSC